MKLLITQWLILMSSCFCIVSKQLIEAIATIATTHNLCLANCALNVVATILLYTLKNLIPIATLTPTCSYN